jgi:hypothetical protein
MTHAKPKDDEQASLWKRLVDNQLTIPDTWEVALSGGANKKETFERLLQEGKLGYLALLRNLRNMVESNVDSTLVKNAILARKGADKVLPFRYIAAARNAIKYEPELDIALQQSVELLPTFKGHTVLLIDVSGSMDSQLSSKSDMTRLDAASALGVIVKSEDTSVFTFSNRVVQVPSRKGMAGIDAIKNSQSHDGTYLTSAINTINNDIKYDRIIVITDEQSHDGCIAPLYGSKGYMINVGTSKNGVGYGSWTHIDGFSENVIRFITECENN